MKKNITNRKKPLFPSQEGGWDTKALPLLVAAYGTAQVNRMTGFVERLGEGGVLTRVQSMLGYDINVDTSLRFQENAKSLNRMAGLQTFEPVFYPVQEGFNRNPAGFMKYEGRLDRDQDRIVNDMRAHSEQLGAAPQLIVEFLGFGSHAVLGTRLHKKLKKAFPSSLFLPVLLIPDDAPLEGWMREWTWSVYENALAGETVLITDNAVGVREELDHRLSVGLASFEVAAETDAKTSGALSDIVNSLSSFGGGWFGMSTVSFRLPTVRKLSWLRPPLRQYKLAGGRSEQLSLLAKEAVWQSTMPEAQLAKHNPPSDTAPQRIVVTMPMRHKPLDDLKQDILDQLKRERFFETYPKTTVSFAAANMPGKYEVDDGERTGKEIAWFRSVGRFFRGILDATFGKGGEELYLHVTRMYPLEGPIESVQRVMNADHESFAANQAIENTGFGSKHHMVSREAVPSNGNKVAIH